MRAMTTIAIFLASCGSAQDLDLNPPACESPTYDAGAVEQDAAPADVGTDLVQADSGADSAADAYELDAAADRSPVQVTPCDVIDICDGLDCGGVSYGSMCGTVKQGSFNCGDVSGFVFSDGKVYTCDRLSTGAVDCAIASLSASQHCAAVQRDQ